MAQQIEDNQIMYEKLKNTTLKENEIDILFIAYRAYKNGLSHKYQYYCKFLGLSEVALNKYIKILREKNHITTPKRGRKNVIYLN